MYPLNASDSYRRRAAAEYRFALVTRDYIRLAPSRDTRWRRRRRQQSDRRD